MVLTKANIHNNTKQDAIGLNVILSNNQGQEPLIRQSPLELHKYKITKA